MADIIYDKNEVVFTKGDPSDFAYRIKFGEIEILKDFPDRPVRLAVLSDGDIFGEMGLVDERPRLLTARATEETRVSKISRDEFVDLMLDRPEEALSYLRMFFERLRAMNMRVGKGSVPDTDQKQIKRFLVTLYPAGKASAKFVEENGIVLSKFPFRVGRKSSRQADPFEVNDLSLLDSRPFNVSRNHFSIEEEADGIFVHDRGSYLGTIVNGKSIGGHHVEARIALRSGDNDLIVGTQGSPFKFRINIESG